jgi:CheY-like chemotaxis protein
MTSRILLAEDNESLVTLLRQVLVGQGYQVSAARSGTEALSLLERDPPDLLVLDLRLPELSGIDVLRKVRATPRWQALPVVVMTGHFKGEKCAAAARQLGVSHYLEKPFTREAFMSAVRECTEPAVAGHRAGQTLLEQILEIYRAGRSGLLTVAGSPPVVFAKGEPCSFLARGESSFPSYLVAKRKISPEDRRIFLESGEERLFFTQSGVLSYEELTEESRHFLAGCLLRSLAATENISFVEGVAVGELPLVPQSVPRLIYEAAKHQPALLACCPLPPDAVHRYPARTTRFYRLANLTTLYKDDIDLLARLDGRQSVGQLLAGSSDGTAAGHFLHYLFLLGMITLSELPTREALPDFPQKALFNKSLDEDSVPEFTTVGFDDLVAEVSQTVAQAVGEAGIAAPLSADEIDFEQGVQRDYSYIKDKDYYALFGMTPGAFSFDALKKAYFAKAHQYSPERFMELSGPIQSMAQEILSVYSHAYSTLSSVVAKERYDEMLNADTVMTLDGKKDDELQARIQFQSGSVFLEMGEYENAEKALQEAYTLEPDNSRHCAFLGWSIYRNPVNRGSKAARDKALSLLTRSLQLEKTAEAFSFRGWMLLDEGRDGLAEGEFLKSLKLNPREMNARRGIRQIAERREGERKGILRRLFG